MHLPYNSDKLFLGILPNKNKNICPNKDLCIDIHSSFFSIIIQTGNTLVTINRYRNKENTVYNDIIKQ